MNIQERRALFIAVAYLKINATVTLLMNENNDIVVRHPSLKMSYDSRHGKDADSLRIDARGHGFDPL